ncbi:putative quinol monooxygenase [Pseudomonas sp. DTU_2021_1001937_2_SI_NGA_ILE_001]|uniref:putative quinol monooxygenase n=1 Tax=Pseudomonas sp. DTU_2021_1001937_2_SI_NGA_ILE_001 TaxID=3077589 RepID=UPI0028FC10B2|nr:putative quinol monooxygenase [Pseudomonas sp. DTU_2021_1001937_2_SI_NGA_ILE_001]WNW12764.1 putative quinol monooxygenase [Pseudomonas sp. DTU_2021_1001937_2_SI_NGA_ILE_001]
MPQPIYTVAHITAEPSSVKDVYEALLKAVEETRSEEGCLHYDLFRVLDNPANWTMLEAWQSEAALVKHTTGDAFRALSRAIEDKATIVVFRLAPVALNSGEHSTIRPSFWIGNGLP